MASAENELLYICVGLLQVGHVLDYRNSRDFELIPHLYSLDDIDISESLRSGHDNRSSVLDLLAEGDGNIPCAWRRIKDQIVKFSPLSHLGELLLPSAIAEALEWP